MGHEEKRFNNSILWIKKMWYIYVCVCVCVCVYTIEYYSAIKKNEIMPWAATWMDLEMIILSEVKRVGEG